MKVKTKLIITILSILCAIVIIAFGIFAVTFSYDNDIVNTSKLQFVGVDGSLYGWRYGTKGGDIAGDILYSESHGVYNDNLDHFLEDTDFASGQAQIEYVYYLVRDQVSESDTWVNLDNVVLSDNTYLVTSYKYAFSKTEPNWASAKNITGTLACTKDNPYLWIRIVLAAQNNGVNVVIEDVEWSYTLNFYGNMETK